MITHRLLSVHKPIKPFPELTLKHTLIDAETSLDYQRQVHTSYNPTYTLWYLRYNLFNSGYNDLMKAIV